MVLLLRPPSSKTACVVPGNLALVLVPGSTVHPAHRPFDCDVRLASASRAPPPLHGSLLARGHRRDARGVLADADLRGRIRECAASRARDPLRAVRPLPEHHPGMARRLAPGMETQRRGIRLHGMSRAVCVPGPSLRSAAAASHSIGPHGGQETCAHWSLRGAGGPYSPPTPTPL